MRRWMLAILGNVLAFYVASLIFPGISVESPLTFFIAGFILGLVNLLIRPLILVLTLPLNFLTLGIFTLVINAWMVMFTSFLLPGLDIQGFWLALGTSLIISLANWLVKGLTKHN